MAVNIVPTATFNRAVAGDREAALEGFNHALGAAALAKGQDQDAVKSAQEEGLLMYFAAMGPLATHGSDVQNTPEVLEDLELLGQDLVFDDGLFQDARSVMNERDQLISDGFLVAYKKSAKGSDGLDKDIYMVDILARAPELTEPPADVIASTPQESTDLIARFAAAISPETIAAQRNQVVDALKAAWARIAAAKEGIADAQTFDFSQDEEWVKEQLAAAGEPPQEPAPGTMFDLTQDPEFIAEQLGDYRESKEPPSQQLPPNQPPRKGDVAASQKGGGGTMVVVGLAALILGGLLLMGKKKK